MRGGFYCQSTQVDLVFNDFVSMPAVRAGQLAKFSEVLDQYGNKFKAEGTYTLIVRLRHNVIKTGVRMISLSYSRISLSDVATKLLLDSPEDAEFIVAKVSKDPTDNQSFNQSFNQSIFR